MEITKYKCEMCDTETADRNGKWLMIAPKGGFILYQGSTRAEILVGDSRQFDFCCPSCALTYFNSIINQLTNPKKEPANATSL